MHRAALRHLAIAASAVAILASPARARSEPALPDGMHWRLDLDVRLLLAGEIGVWARAAAAAPEHALKLALFEAMTGFDPRRDLDNITVAGADDERESAVVYLRGRFDRDGLRRLAKVAPGHQVEERADVTLHRWEDPGRDGAPAWGCLLPGARLLVLASSEGAITRAIAALRTGETGDQSLPPPPSEHFLSAAVREPSSWAGNTVGRWVFPDIYSIDGAFAEEGDRVRGQVVFATAGKRDARRLARLGERLLQLGRSSEDLDAVAERLLAHIELTRVGRTVSCRGDWPLAELRAALGRERHLPAAPAR